MEWDAEFDLFNETTGEIDFFIARTDDLAADLDAPSFEVSGTTPFSGAQSRGGFSAAYGPFRRFSGGDNEYESLVRSYPRLVRHLSLFDERVALTECLDWLRQLRFQQLEASSEGDLLDRLKEFINQEGFLPFGTRLHEISSQWAIQPSGLR